MLGDHVVHMQLDIRHRLDANCGFYLLDANCGFYLLDASSSSSCIQPVSFRLYLIFADLSQVLETTCIKVVDKKS